MIDIPLSAVADGVITEQHARAIAGAITDHAGAFELRLHELTDDEREALDRLIVWLDHARRCGR